MKPIKYTEEVIKELALKAYVDVVTKLTTDAVACHGKSKGTPVAQNDRPSIFIEEDAVRKIHALVSLCTDEIAWYATVNRLGDDNVFYIKDILVPPQNVTPASVDSDPTEFALWSATLSDDTINHLRCHMHSHVNMSVFSSAVDDDYQKDMVTKDAKDYMLFLIFNKRGEVFARIYDIKNNVMYDNEDIDIHYSDSTYDWACEQIKDKVKHITHCDRPSSYHF